MSESVKTKVIEPYYAASLEIRIISAILLFVSQIFFFLLKEDVSSLPLNLNVTLAKPASQTFLYSISIIGLISHAPLTLLAGKILYKDSFLYFQPFRGGKRFIVLQMVGWFLYGHSLITFMLSINENMMSSDKQRYLINITILDAIISHCFLNYSISIFKTNSKTTTKLGLFILLNKIRIKRAIKITLLALTSLIICDFIKFIEPKTSTKTLTLIQLSSTIAFLVSYLLTYFNISVDERKQNILKYLFRPVAIGGGSFYIVLESIGWTVCLVQVAILPFMYSKNVFIRPGALTTYGVSGVIAQIIFLMANSQYKKQQKRRNFTYKAMTALIMSNCFVGVLVTFYVTSDENVWFRLYLQYIFNFYFTFSNFLLCFKDTFMINKVQKEHNLLLGCAILLFLFYYLTQFVGYDFIVSVPYGALGQLVISLSFFVNDENIVIESEIELKENKGQNKSKLLFLLELLFPCLSLSSLLFCCFKQRDYGKYSLICQGIAGFLLHLTSVNFEMTKSFKFFIPFDGASKFIVLQAIGWTLFGVLVFLKLLLPVNENMFLILFIEVLTFTCLSLSYKFYNIKDLSLNNLEKESLVQNELKTIKEYNEIIKQKTGSYSKIFEALVELSEEDPNLDITSILKSYNNKGKSKYRASVYLIIQVVITHIIGFYYSLNLFLNFELEDKFSTKKLLFLSLFVFFNSTSILTLSGKAAARSKGQKYRLFQGGLNSLILSIIGFSLLLSGLISSTISIEITKNNVICSGVFYFIGQCLLLWSILEYNYTNKSTEWNNFCQRNSIGFLREKWNFLILIVLIFSLVDLIFWRLNIEKDSVTVQSYLLFISCCTTLYWAVALYQKTSLSQISTVSKSLDLSLLLIGIFCSFVVMAFSLLFTDLISTKLFNTSNNFLLTPILSTTNIFARTFLTTERETEYGMNTTIQYFSTILTFIIGSIIFFIFTQFILRFIRFVLDFPISFIIKSAKRDSSFISPDNEQALKNIWICRDKFYMNDKRFTNESQQYDKMVPLNQTKDKLLEGQKLIHQVPIIYLHGGGHICVNREILHHSVTPLVRDGFSLYSVEYPLSPEWRYPTPVLTSIRAILHISKTHCPNLCVGSKCKIESNSSFHECNFECKQLNETETEYCKSCGSKLGSKEVILLGDSAGGNLVTMCTLFMSNPELLQEVLKGNQMFNDLTKVTKFPSVKKLISIYGLVSRKGPILENSFLQFAVQKVIDWLFSIYEDSGASSQATLDDILIENLKSFAEESMFVCGKSDPLITGNRTVIGRLENNKNIGAIVYKEYPGNHGYLGWPSRWSQYLGYNWKDNAFQCTIDILEFLTEEKKMKLRNVMKIEHKYDFDRVLAVAGPLLLSVALAFLFLLVCIFYISFQSLFVLRFLAKVEI